MKKLITLLALTGSLFFATTTFATTTAENDQTTTTEAVATSTDQGSNTDANVSGTTANTQNSDTKGSADANKDNANNPNNKGGILGGGIWTQVLFWILLIAVIYFFMIRPASKRRKEAEKFKDSLKKGSKVITAGGIYGIIDEINDTYVLLEISNGVKIKIDKNSIVSFTEAEAQSNESAEKK